MSHGFDTLAVGPSCLAPDAITPPNPVSAAMHATTVNRIMMSILPPAESDRIGPDVRMLGVAASAIARVSELEADARRYVEELSRP
jgi:hypothetical protein